MLTGEYAGYTIKYMEGYPKPFVAYDKDERVAESISLDNLRKRLDRIGVVRAAFTPFTILRFNDKMEEWTVTSIASPSEIWASGPNGRRKLTTARDYDAVYVDSPTARSVMTDATEQIRRARAAIKAATDAVAALPRYHPDRSQPTEEVERE